VADVADLALVDKVREGAQGLLDVGERIGSMHLAEVDPVGSKPPQRFLDAGDDPAARGAAPMRVVADRVADLGRQEDVVDSPAE
jgi:hypothetical protein